MRFEFRLRISPVALEVSSYDGFIPFCLTLWRYDGSHGHSVCNLRWNHFAWHGWRDKAQIRFTVTPRIGTVTFEPEDERDEIIGA